MTSRRERHSRFARIGIAALLLSAVSAAPAFARDPLKLPGTQYEPIAWPMIDGWADDDHNAAFATFLNSCKAILQGPASRDGQPMLGALYKVCQKAVVAKVEKPGEARAFFETNFRPVRISPLGKSEGFVTGYYEPIVEGTREQTGGFEFPLYRKPPTLNGGRMSVTSSDSGKKKKRGRKRKFVAYYDRAAIDDGILAGRDLEICWLKDPVDAFFAHIQGSVRVLLDDGKIMRLNYQAANGQPYYAVGRWLIEHNIVSKDDMSMDRIREWMDRNPKEGEELRRRNKSYVFFHETNLSSNEEPIGAQGISLTPGRSIAVDRKLHTYGTPFFISGYLPIEGLKPDTWFRRLMIAQDTGGAIVGPARADLYFGAGDEAASVAGRMRHDARFVMLAPKELVPAKDDEIPLPLPRPAVLISEEEPAASPAVVVEAKPEIAEPAVKAAAERASNAENKPAVAAESKSAKAAKNKPEKVVEAGKPAVAVAIDTKPVKAADKPADKPLTVATRTPEPASKKAMELASKPPHAAEKNKPRKKGEKAGAKTASTKTASSKTDAWEARVMPVIPPDSPAKQSTSKKKK